MSIRSFRPATLDKITPINHKYINGNQRGHLERLERKKPNILLPVTRLVSSPERNREYNTREHTNTMDMKDKPVSPYNVYGIEEIFPTNLLEYERPYHGHFERTDALFGKNRLLYQRIPHNVEHSVLTGHVKHVADTVKTTKYMDNYDNVVKEATKRKEVLNTDKSTSQTDDKNTSISQYNHNVPLITDYKHSEALYSGKSTSQTDDKNTSISQYNHNFPLITDYKHSESLYSDKSTSQTVDKNTSISQYNHNFPLITDYKHSEALYSDKSTSQTDDKNTSISQYNHNFPLITDYKHSEALYSDKSTSQTDDKNTSISQYNHNFPLITDYKHSEALYSDKSTSPTDDTNTSISQVHYTLDNITNNGTVSPPQNNDLIPLDTTFKEFTSLNSYYQISSNNFNKFDHNTKQNPNIPNKLFYNLKQNDAPKLSYSIYHPSQEALNPFNLSVDIKSPTVSSGVSTCPIETKAIQTDSSYTCKDCQKLHTHFALLVEGGFLSLPIVNYNFIHDIRNCSCSSRSGTDKEINQYLTHLHHLCQRGIGKPKVLKNKSYRQCGACRK